jgi:hypothetical protein
MAQADLLSWLNSDRDFDTGLALLEQLQGESALVLVMKASGSTKYNREKLATTLQQQIDHQVGHPVTAISSVTRTTAREIEIKLNASTKAPVSPELKALYDERSQLHAQLKVLATDQERQVAAFRILELTDQIDAILDPKPAAAAAPAVELTGSAEMMRKLTNARSNRTKLKKNPDRADDLAKCEQEIEQLEKALGKR